MKYIIHTLKNLTFPPINLAPHHNNVVLAVVCVINHVVQQQHQVLVFTKHFTLASLFSSYFSYLSQLFYIQLYSKFYICITFHLLFYMFYSHNCFTPYILQPSSPYRLHGPTAWGPGDTKRPTGHGDHPATPAFSTRGIQLEIQFENNFVASSNNIEIHWKIKGFWPHVLDYKQELMTK